MQTLGATWLRSRIAVPLERERLELPDGDFLDLDFAFERPARGATDGRPIVLVLHGLEGSARSGYALEIYRSLRSLGIDAVGLNFRSCGGEMNRLPRLYHSGETEDLRWVVRLLAERYPTRPRGAIGVSIGGNVLLKYLGESGDEASAYIEAAAAISVPFDLAAGADHLNRLGGRLYSAHLLQKMRGKLRQKSAMMPAAVDLARASVARGFRDFDDAATAPLHGFKNAEEYYTRSSSFRYLDGIRVVTSLFQSADDPFLPRECFPRAAIARNPLLHATVTVRGGHIGFVSGKSPLSPVFWAEREAAKFVARRLLTK